MAVRAAMFTNATAVDLAMSLTNSVVTAGDTIWLRGGVYFPPYRCAALTGTNANSPTNGYGWTVSISGAQGNLITIRSYPGELAKIDRPWRFGASEYLRFRDIEFYDSLKGFDPGNASYPNPRPWGHFDDNKAYAGHEWINCIVHDVNNAWSGATAGATVRGCMIWNVGNSSLDHVFYPASATISGNIIGWAIDNVTQGLQSTLPLTIVQSNIVFGTAQTLPSENGNDWSLSGSNTVVAWNNTYNKWTNHSGVSVIVNSSTSVSNNVLVGIPITFGTCANVVFSNNVLVLNQPVSYPTVTRRIHSGTWAVNSNAYYAASPSTVYFDTNNANITFSQWKSTYAGFDTESVSFDSTLPSNTIRVIPNQDNPKRGHIAIYNWASAGAVSVNASSILNAGDYYSLYSAQNFAAGAIQTGIYDGNSISVPMTNLTVASILYNTNTYYGTMISPPLTSPEFAAFVLIGGGNYLASITVSNLIIGP